MPPFTFVTAASSKQLNAAKNLHKLGRLDDAEKIYREILAKEKQNAEVMGLLAVIAQYRNDLKFAKQLWRQSLEVKSDPTIFLRNLQNLILTLIKEGNKAEAAKIADKHPFSWPTLRVPDPSERRMLLTLSQMLVELARVDLAAKMLESVVVSLPNDIELLYELAKAQEKRGEFESAWQALVAADAALQPRVNYELLHILHAFAKNFGKEEEARSLKHRIATESPVFILSKHPGQTANILILSGIPGFVSAVHSEYSLHFNHNYPTQLTKHFADEFRFASVFSGVPEGRSAKPMLPTPDLIINDNTNAEILIMGGELEAEAAFADSFGVPVINPPHQVVHTTRDRSAELVEGIPNLLVPRTVRFSRTGKTIDELVKEIESRYDYPLITRTLSRQEGKGMVKVDDRDALFRALRNSKHNDFFVTAFVDSRGATGFYRKIRAAIVSQEIIIVRVDYDSHWNVHGRKSDERVAFYLSHPELLAEEERICAEPNEALGEDVMRCLRMIRERIPLDVFGIDFDVSPSGQVVFYEANATMNLLSSARPEVDHPKHAEERLKSAFRNYFNDLISRK